MTKDIILTISGMHETDGESDAPVEIITPGQYYLKNGKHYILFDEVMEGLEGTIKSTIKISEKQVELLRSGVASTRMVFEKDQEHNMLYHTPMGPLAISVYTENIISEFKEDEMNLGISYSLKADEQVITESHIKINVCSKEQKKFEK